MESFAQNADPVTATPTGIQELDEVTMGGASWRFHCNRCKTFNGEDGFLSNYCLSHIGKIPEFIYSVLQYGNASGTNCTTFSRNESSSQFTSYNVGIKYNIVQIQSNPFYGLFIKESKRKKKTLSTGQLDKLSYALDGNVELPEMLKPSWFINCLVDITLYWNSPFTVGTVANTRRGS